jgi:hypothetical protein
MKNKLIIGSLAFLTIATTASFAFAQNNGLGEGNKGEGKGTATAPMMVNIGPKGNVELRGTLSSVSGNTLTIASWGGNWIVDAANAKLTRKEGGKSSGLSEFQIGDWIAVNGSVGTSSAWFISARHVRDESLVVRKAAMSGTISNLNSSNSSFTFSVKNGKTASVTVNTDAKIWVGKASSTFSGLSNGMFAEVSGLWNRTQETIFAGMVRARIISTSTVAH